MKVSGQSVESGVLVDTSAWVEFLRRDGQPAMRAAVSTVLSGGHARLCEPVLLELWCGARGGKERRVITDIERTVPCLPCGAAAWRRAGAYAARLRSSGLTVAATDILILAIADENGARILAVDRDFARMGSRLRTGINS